MLKAQHISVVYQRKLNKSTSMGQRLHWLIITPFPSFLCSQSDACGGKVQQVAKAKMGWLVMSKQEVTNQLFRHNLFKKNLFLIQLNSYIHVHINFRH